MHTVLKPSTWRRRTWIVLSTLTASLALASSLPALAQDKITIKIGHIAASDSFLITRQLGGLRDALQKTGKVNVVMHGTGSPFSNPGKFSELVEQGVLDIAYGIQQFEGSRFPLNLILSEPLLVDDNLKATAVYQKLAKSTPALLKEFAPNRLMTVSFATGEVIHSHKVQIKNVDGLKDLRVLATNPGVQAILRNVGASVVALPSSASYENLQKGVVDAVSSTWTNVNAFKLAEITCCHYEIRSATTEVYVAVNQGRYASYPPEVRKVIDDFSTEEAAVSMARAFYDTDQIAREDAIKRGHTIVTPTQAERDAIKKRFRHFTDERVADLEKKGLPARTVLESFIRAAN